jgi:hypothetical protein
VQYSTVQYSTVQYSALQRPVMHLDVFTPQRPELRLDVPGHQEHVLLLNVNFAFLKSWMLPLGLQVDINITFGILYFFV